MNNKPVVFVTGGSRGIGRAVVEKFQAQGWMVAACATTEQGAHAAGADLNLVCDVANINSVRTTIRTIMDICQRLDAVINNAGVAGSNSLDPNDSDEMWQRIMDVNLNGTYYVSKYILPHLPDKQGRIVNISSILGLTGAPDVTAYCAAKHGVLGFTKALALQLAPRGITANAICPGWVRTDMGRERWQAIGFSDDNIVDTVPLGRVVEPHEVADLAYYLVASEGAKGITGQAFTIDGGAMA
jgi:NAD(P)-dependent dehydrogenase (short-subunit alcohol dehydrogenase family)